MNSFTGPILGIAFTMTLASGVGEAAFTITSRSDTILQDNDNNGTADSFFGYPNPPDPNGIFTQKSKPTQPGFVEDRAVIRFDLSSIANFSVSSATLKLFQSSNFRGLQTGTVGVYGFEDDSVREADDYTGGSFLGTISAPGEVGATVLLDVTPFIATAAATYSSGSGFAVFRLENPVTTDLTGNPYSLSFYSTGVSSSTNPTLIIEAIPETSSSVILGLAVTGTMLGRRRKRTA